MRALAQNRTLRTVPALAATKALASSHTLVAADYLSRVRNTRFSSSAEYWPLNEVSGAVAIGNIYGRNGATSGATVGQPGIGDGRMAYLFDGVNDFVNIYTPSFAAAFNGSEGSILGWMQYAGSWAAAGVERCWNLQVNSSNRVTFGKNNANTLRFLYIAGGVTKNIDYAFTSSSWTCIVITWSFAADRAALWVNGMDVASATGLGVWGGALAAGFTTIGAGGTTGTNVWNGSLGHIKVWNVALTAGEIAELALVLP